MSSFFKTERQPIIGLTLIILLYLALAVAFSQVTPFNKGPDEGINLDHIKFITANGRLPITYEERDEVGPKANWPALYHIMLAGIGNLFDIDVEGPPYIKIFWDSFRYRALDVEAESVWFLSTEDFNWPYYGLILILHIGRWLSVVFSSATLILVYLTATEILPEKRWQAVAAVAVLAFIPMYIFMGSVLNEDALVAFLAALYFWLLIKIVKHPESLWRYGILGLILGLSVTAKYTTIVLPLEIVLITIIIAQQRQKHWAWWLKRVALAGVGAIIGSSWWFGWNFWYLNEVEELGFVAGLLRPIFTGGTDVTLARLGNFFSGGQIGLNTLPADAEVGTFSRWITKTFITFWGLNIGDAVPLASVAYPAVGLIIVGVSIGLVFLWKSQPRRRYWIALMLFHLGLFLLLPLLRFSLSGRIGQTAQGRHILIPAATAISILMVWGLAAVVPGRWQRLVFTVIVAGLVIWAGFHVYHLSVFGSHPLPLRTVSEGVEWLPNRAHVKFGEVMELSSYEVAPNPEAGILHLNLAWKALAPMNQNYLLQVDLVNVQGQTVSHWVGYNGQGRVPTLAWDAGDIIFDRLALPLPTGLSPGDYTVHLQVSGNTDMLPVIYDDANKQIVELAQQNVAQYERLALDTISLRQPPQLSLSENVAIISEEMDSPTSVDFALWCADGPVGSGRPAIYRYPGTITVVTGRDDVDVSLLDDQGNVWLATRNKANIYIFVIGPRWRNGEYRLQFSVIDANGQTAQSTTEPLLTVENWWERRFDAPEIAVPLEANFANQVRLLGYKLPQSQVTAGEAFPVTLYWQAPSNTAPQADFTQFNHLHDSSGVLRGGYDRRPLEYYSTLLWAPGEIVIDGYAVPVDADAPPGEYYLDVGYYLTVGEAAVNLPLVVDGEMTGVTTVTIGPVQVTAVE